MKPSVSNILGRISYFPGVNEHFARLLSKKIKKKQKKVRNTRIERVTVCTGFNQVSTDLQSGALPTELIPQPADFCVSYNLNQASAKPGMEKKRPLRAFAASASLSDIRSTK